jgi:hypothetical protein
MIIVGFVYAVCKHPSACSLSVLGHVVSGEDACGVVFCDPNVFEQLQSYVWGLPLTCHQGPLLVLQMAAYDRRWLDCQLLGRLLS